MTDLKTKLGPVTLNGPIVAASGTVGSVVDFIDTIDFSVYGAAVAKSVAPEPWPGRIAPRIGPVGVGMMNGIGIQNPGIDRWLDEVGPKLPTIDCPVWGSAVAHDLDGFAEVAAKMDTGPVEAIEVNLSCPNLDGSPFALDPALSAQVVAAVRRVTTKPIGAKLSPDAMPVADVATAVVEAGADWLVMGNTVMGAAFDPHTRRPILSGVVGGYSGAPIRPITIRCILEIRRTLPEVPIIGCGGVSTLDHVLEYTLSGANAVGVGSAHLDTPRVVSRIMKDLTKYLDKHGLESLSELNGAWEPWE